LSRSKYIPLDAREVLSKFMVNDWPDENLFNQVINEVIVKAKGNNRNVRAFGEMVAILWAKGQAHLQRPYEDDGYGERENGPFLQAR
jgi:hypothetical protein